MSNIHLYLSPGSCALASHILLREIGAKFDITKISITFENKFPDSLSHVNPKRRVPILQVDDEIITESPAIMTAISQLAPEKNLMGSSAIETVRVYEWLNWLSGTLHTSAYGALLRPERFITDSSQFPAIREKAKDSARECYEAIEKRLEGKTWAVGDGFTAVDTYLLVFWRWGNGGGFKMSELYPNYGRLIGEVIKRKSVRDAVKEEGIELLKDHTM